MLPVLAKAEWTVFKKVRDASRFKAVLNEKKVPETRQIRLPPSYKGRIIPPDMFELRSHPDIRIARRATTIAALAADHQRTACETGPAPHPRYTGEALAGPLSHSGWVISRRCLLRKKREEEDTGEDIA